MMSFIRTAPLAVSWRRWLFMGQDAKPKPALWSLRPVVRPMVEANGANPIDQLIARRHQQKGLRAAGRADKATLLRRVYLDLTGLRSPPKWTLSWPTTRPTPTPK